MVSEIFKEKQFFWGFRISYERWDDFIPKMFEKYTYIYICIYMSWPIFGIVRSTQRAPLSLRDVTQSLTFSRGSKYCVEAETIFKNRGNELGDLFCYHFCSSRNFKSTPRLNGFHLDVSCESVLSPKPWGKMIPNLISTPEN